MTSWATLFKLLCLISYDSLMRFVENVKLA